VRARDRAKLGYGAARALDPARLGYAAVLAACTVAAAFVRGPVAGAVAPSFEWPATWDGRPLRPLAPSALEQRFAARFPGAIVRLTDGERELVLREVNEPTRMLHPAADCFRGVGYRVAGERLEVDDLARRWRCFDATRDGAALRVCERIADANGREFTDPSSWFWAALSGRSTGPWLAVTVAQAR
jgi:hypothetical protein